MTHRTCISTFRHVSPHIAALLAVIVSLAGVGQDAAVRAEDVSFREQLAPVLVRRCLGCHNNRRSEGRYAVHTFEQLLRTGDSEERPVVPGRPDDSYLFRRLIEPDPSQRMPQEDEPLSPNEIALFRSWIEQGARFDGPAVVDRLVTLLPPRQHPQSPQQYRRPIPVFALRFSPDGQSLVTSGLHEVLVWDTGTGTLKQRIGGMPQRMHGLRFSPDGMILAVAGGAPGEYGEIRLIHQGDQSVRTLPAWEDVVLDVAFSHDGQRLVAGGADNSVRAYDVATAQEVWRTQQHADWVTAVDVTDYSFAEMVVPNEPAAEGFEFSEQERSSGSHLQQLWTFPDGRFIVRKANWELECFQETVISLTRITTSGIGKTYTEQRERVAGEAIQQHSAVMATLQDVRQNPGLAASASPWVVSSSRDRTVKVFALRTGALFTTYKGHRREYGPLAGLHRVFGVRTEPGTRRVWSGGEGLHVHGWNPLTVRDEDGTAADMEARFAREYSVDLLRHDHADGVFALVRADKHLVAAAPDGQVQRFLISGPEAVFDLKQPAPAELFFGLTDQLFAVDAHPTTGRIAAGGLRGDVAIWSTTSPQPVIQFRASP